MEEIRQEIPNEGDATSPEEPQNLQPKSKPTVACLRCRDQKLKCDREQPSCMRCRKQKARCSYPLPPDRKKIAQNIKARRSRATVHLVAPIAMEHTEEDRTQPSDYALQPSTKKQRISTDNHDLHASETTEESDTAALPSTEMGLLLLEVYFKRVYNATLLFHKTISFQLYMQNELPPFLIRAIFALAAIFLKEPDSPYKQYIKVLPVHTLSDKSWVWARSASKAVLSHADEPTLVKIEALQILQLYYFSQGEIQRSAVHASLAYQLCQLLKYDKLHEDETLVSSSLSWHFDREMRRRCFWTSWCSLCIGHNKSDSSRACEDVVGLPLPAQFEKGGSLKGVVLNLSQKMDANWELSVDYVPTGKSAGLLPCSLIAELVKVLGIWTKVQAFNSDSATKSHTQREIHFSQLGKLFKSIEKSLDLPIIDLGSRAGRYDESPELLASVCSIYYLSKLLLHVSMIPTLSGRPLESPASTESVVKTAETALQQANEIAALLQRFVAQDLDMTRLCPFTAHAAFVAGNFFLVYESIMQAGEPPCHPIIVPGPYSEDINIIQTVLGVLGIYWAPLRRLAVKFNETVDAVGRSSLEGPRNTELMADLWEYPFSLV